jgi:chloramphenicol 3-O phosphotransferase
MTLKGNIIILDGCPSAGKTTTALSLQKILEPPFLYLGIDEMMRTLPDSLIEFVSAKNEPNTEVKGIRFVQESNDLGVTSISVKIGYYGDKMIQGYINAVKGFAKAGNNVICDTIITDVKWLNLLKTHLKDFRVNFIGLYAPLEVVEKREALRNEPLGMARGRFYEVYADTKKYDLVIDRGQLRIRIIKHVKDFAVSVKV